MSNYQQRSAHLLDRRVILVVRNASTIASNNPDAVVVDLAERAIWQNEDCWLVSGTGERACIMGRRRPNQLFRFVVMMLTNHDRLITRDVFYACLWADDPHGGPLSPGGVYYVLRSRSGDLFDWLGLTVENCGRMGWRPRLAQGQPLSKAA